MMLIFPTRINPPDADKPIRGGKPVGAKRKSRFVGEIPKHKYQIPNKSQHAAQAPALRVIEIPKYKQKNDPKERKF